jgi:prepilin-type N-terminal cleavage/methylation domain-containing protein
MKKKAFTLIELLVVMAIIAMLLSLVVTGVKKVREQKVVDEQAEAYNNAVVVVISDDSAMARQDQINKIELKPAFSGPGVKVYLTNTPSNSEIIVENGKSYLMWAPENTETLKTTIITKSADMKEEREIKIFVE